MQFLLEPSLRHQMSVLCSLMSYTALVCGMVINAIWPLTLKELWISCDMVTRVYSLTFKCLSNQNLLAALTFILRFAIVVCNLLFGINFVDLLCFFLDLSFQLPFGLNNLMQCLWVGSMMNQSFHGVIWNVSHPQFAYFLIGLKLRKSPGKSTNFLRFIFNLLLRHFLW